MTLADETETNEKKIMNRNERVKRAKKKSSNVESEFDQFSMKLTAISPPRFTQHHSFDWQTNRITNRHGIIIIDMSVFCVKGIK